MNVGELKALLADFDDYLPVMFYCETNYKENEFVDITEVEADIDHGPITVGVLLS